MRTQSAVTFAIFVLCTVTSAIRVPVDWEGASAVSDGQQSESYVNQQPQIPVQYFEYPAQKPQFAVDVAAFHGVKNPEQHYSAYPVHPYTGKDKPVLGKHKIQDESNPVFQQFQQYTKINEDDNKHVVPVTSDYEVFHPYKAEIPALQQLYKDPVLDKIRDDIKNSQYRLQQYEKEAGKPNIENDEYLESPETTDRKKIPQRNIPAPYEIHRPQRRPIYYRPGPNLNRDHILNHKFRHPWNQHNAKIRPVHYRPLRQHLQRLRQNHAMKYDDEHNEYPQIPQPEQIAEVPDGYDIYEKGKAKYTALRNNVDESINNLVKENRPTIYQKLELHNNGDRTETQISDDEEPEFVPIKNYAQVRKTETTKHLPRTAAFEDAASYDEIKNAPRLREAIKSTKAQTVYTEEGYEDAAYDHAGEEKHAAENEAHGGYLKEKEISAGKYKTPSESAKYEDASGSEYRDQALHGKKWKNDDKDKEEQNDEDDYSEDETAQSIEADVYDEVNGGRNKRDDEAKGDEKSSEKDDEDSSTSEEAVERKKRENKLEDKISTSLEISDNNSSDSMHEVNKQATNFKIPKLNFNTTYLTPEKFLEMAKLSVIPNRPNIKEKYPYYFKNLKNVHKDSPLRYAENLKLIPKKSNGGTEFYDSRSILECPEVEDDVNPLPEKLKKGGHPDETSEESEEDNNKEPKKGQAEFEQLKKTQRLKGLGDKIDCFKAKFFGENPLDSPFFKEEIISSPEPIVVPSLPVHKFIAKEPSKHIGDLENVLKLSENLKADTTNVSALLDKLKGEQQSLQETLVKTNQEFRASLAPQTLNIIQEPAPQQSDLYNDVINNIKNTNVQQPFSVRHNQIINHVTQPSTVAPNNITYTSYQNKEEVTKPPQTARRKRAAPFNYEPYKIIRDVQVQESKKTTTTNNVSPLIKKLQSSRVVDNVQQSQLSDQPTKRNVSQRKYKAIDRSQRKNNAQPASDEAKFINVNEDQRKGEPKYEVRLPNHKPEYSPVEKKTAMTVQDYQTRLNKKRYASDELPKEQEEQNRFVSEVLTMPEKEKNSTSRNLRKRRPTIKPYFDLSDLYPKTTSDFEKLAKSVPSQDAIETVPEREPEQVPVRDFSVRTDKMPQDTVYSGVNEEDDDEDEDDDEVEEYNDSGENNDDDNEEEEEEETTAASTPEEEVVTPKPKPSYKVHRAPKQSQFISQKNKDEPQQHKLGLVTRFHNKPTKKAEQDDEIEPENNDDEEEDAPPPAPKYREKKKKSSKSTLVTDTKTYGDGDDEMLKEEVDAMIGVRHNMKEYEPEYEKKQKLRRGPASSNEEEEDSDDDDDDESDEDEKDNDESESLEGSDEDEDENDDENIETTTSEPDKMNTDTPRLQLDLMPIVHKKKMEIHKEIPVNTSAPHYTQFKQDIKEEEIIKEMPPPGKITHKKPGKHLVPLELYKDTKLAEEINKLGAVEIFKENLDLQNGPKHGGNYVALQESNNNGTKEAKRRKSHKKSKEKIFEDTASSQSDPELIELRSTDDNKRSSNMARFLFGSGKKEKLELEKPQDKIPTGRSRSNKRRGDKSAKLIELDEDSDDDVEEEMHGGNYRSQGSSRNSGRLHGGNYRNARLVSQNKKGESSPPKKETAAAAVLNSFAQAIPILTTTPAYILDPSKRMYYYVEV